MIKIKRIYEKIDKTDGYRVLIDRLWPRGIRKDKASIDEWMKEIAPSDELRIWFNHDPKKWQSFKNKYSKELNGKTDLVKHLIKLSQKRNLTLLYSAKDETHNQAIHLKEYLNDIK